MSLCFPDSTIDLAGKPWHLWVLNFFSSLSCSALFISSLVLVWLSLCHKPPGFLNRTPRAGLNWKPFFSDTLRFWVEVTSDTPFTLLLTSTQSSNWVPCNLSGVYFCPPFPLTAPQSWFLSSHTWMSTETFYSILFTAAKCLFKCYIHCCIPLPQIFNCSLVFSSRNFSASQGTPS